MSGKFHDITHENDDNCYEDYRSANGKVKVFFYVCAPMVVSSYPKTDETMYVDQRL